MNTSYFRGFLLATAAASLIPVLACAHADRAQAISYRPCPSSSGCVSFVVSKSNSTEPVPASPIFLLASGAIQPVGVTDSAGVFLAPRELLTSPGASALLFCWDQRSLACTAVRLDTGTAATYDLLNVTLPANPLIHRSQAHASPQASPVPHP